MRTRRQFCGGFITLLSLLSFWTGLSDAAPYGLDSRAPVGPFLNNRLPPVLEQGEWSAAKAFPNLTFPFPMGLLQPPGSSRFYVYCREGTVFYFENDPNTATKTLFLDISSRTQGWDDCGLLGMAFHPGFGNPASTNRGFFYVFYQYSTTPTSGPERPPRTTPTYNRLSRFTVPAGATVADPASELVLIDQYDEDVWHNGGSMFFNPDDGFLYLTLGDEGGFDAQYGNTQVINKGLFSGVIRIDVDSNPTRSHPIRRQPQNDGIQPLSRTAHYGIPNDNPFVNPAGSVLEEFWAIGLRSPHRMSYDPVTRQIWLGDVGATRREEVNLIVKGGNYQWGYREGTLQGPLATPPTIIGTEQPPIYDYGRGNGDITVIGGYVYRGTVHAAELAGKYVFGDNGSGRIWALSTNSGAAPTVTHLCNMPPGFGYGGLASFAVDHDNELYMVQTGPAGQIYKLVRPTTTVPPPPPLLSQTGVFTNTPALAPAAALIPFDVNSPLWSDGAIKTRWMALPNDGPPYALNERIGYVPSGEWSFPDGTVFVKHFDLAIDEANPSLRRRLETRLLVRDTNGAAYGVTYKWRADNSDADLLTDALSEEISIRRTAPVGALANSVDVGGATGGSTTFDSASGVYTITAGGADIWGAGDQFRFVYQQRTGDFDIKARVESLTMADLYTKAGLMARESLDAGSRHVYASVFVDNQPRGANPTGYEAVYRAATSGASQAIYPATSLPAVNYPNTWIRLKRVGNEFTAFGGNDGVTWTKYATVTLALPTSLFFGIAVTSHDIAETTTARVRDLANNTGHAHFYPSPRDCLTCHTPVAKHILGVKTHQLNGNLAYAGTGVTDNQLRTWNHLGLFEPALNETDLPGLARLVAITNTSAPLEDRVRSYLAANCSQCHRPGGVPRANWDARYETPLSLQNIINGLVSEPLGVTGARVVAPASVARSMLHKRVNTLEAFKMPPLARNTIDTAAVAAIAAWINGLPPVANNFGLRAEYFDNIDFTALKLTRADEIINFDWDLGSPDPAVGLDTFSVRWTGLIEPRFSETYTFYTTSDDGVRLWVNGQMIINDWTDHAATENTGTIALTAGQKYDLRLEYYENIGKATIKLAWSSASQPREAIPPSQFSVPVDSWLDRDIGGVGIAGQAQTTNQSITVAGSGADIWDYADGFHYVYRSFVGDGQITARVASLQRTDAWAKAGVMIRESLDPDSSHAFTALTPDFGAAFQRRLSIGALSSHSAGPLARAPYWVRLARTGNSFTASVSSNGVNWIAFGSDTVAMPTNVFIGLAVTAHNNAALATAVFTDVTITQTSFPRPLITAVQRRPDNRLQFQIVNATAGTYTVQSSTNLKQWITITTFATSGNPVTFVEPPSATASPRFYRITAGP